MTSVPFVTGVTAELAAQIEADTVVQAVLSPVGDLIFIMAGGTQINAGPLAVEPSNAVNAGIATLRSFDTVTRDVVVPVWHTGSTMPPALATADVIPSAATVDSKWSPDSNYMVMIQTGAPYLNIYKRSGDNLTRLSSPSTGFPTGSPTGVSWSSNGQYLAISHVTSPWLTVYKRAGDVFTKLADPASLPAGNGDAKWSPDGTYLAVGCTSSPYYNVFKRNGDVLTKLTVTAQTVSNPADKLLWSNGGQYLFLGTVGVSDHVWAFKRFGDTFTRIVSPFSTQPTIGVTGLSITPDDRYLAVSNGGSPGITIYRRVGDAFTKIPDPAVLPPGSSGTGVDFTPDGRFLVVTSSTSPYLIFYRKDGETLTNMLPLPDGISVIPKGPSYSPDGVYLVLCGSGLPYANLLKSALGPVSGAVVKPTPVP